MGRPAKPKDEKLVATTIRLPGAVVGWIDARAAKAGQTRVEWMRSQFIKNYERGSAPPAPVAADPKMASPPAGTGGRNRERAEVSPRFKGKARAGL